MKKKKIFFTFLKESRMHTMLQNPRIKMGSCVPTIKISNIFCISIGNEYHLHWQSSSLNPANSYVTALPNLQYRKIGANDQNAKINGEINSTVLELSSDFEVEMNGIKLHLIKMYGKIFQTCTQLVMQRRRSNYCRL